MNKIVIGIVVSVCVLGMALIMLNERLNGNKQNLVTEQKEIVSQPYTVTTPTLKPQGTNEPKYYQTQNSLGPVNPAYEETTQGESNEPQKPAIITNERSKIRAQANLEPRQQIKQPPALTEKTEPVIQPISRTNEDMRLSEREREKTVKPAASQTRLEAKAEKSEVTKKEVAKKETAKKEVEKTHTPKVETKKEVAKKELAKKEDKKPEEKKNYQIKKFVVFNRDRGATIRLQGDSPLRYKNSNMHNPERILLDLDGNWKVVAPGVPKNPLVTNVRIGKYPNRTRIVVDLKEKPKNSRIVLAQDRHTIDIRVDQ